jgi:hypothetical protein
MSLELAVTNHAQCPSPRVPSEQRRQSAMAQGPGIDTVRTANSAAYKVDCVEILFMEECEEWSSAKY